MSVKKAIKMLYKMIDSCRESSKRINELTSDWPEDSLTRSMNKLAFIFEGQAQGLEQVIKELSSKKR